jgi:hypothetical protein
MKLSKTLIVPLLLSLVLIVSACNLQLQEQGQVNETKDQVILDSPTPEAPAPTEEPQPTDSEVDEAESGSSKLVSFDQLGISLEVPGDLFVSKAPGVNYDDPGKLDGYIFFIQNYGQRGGPGSGDFQMYGHYQYSLRSLSWDEFADNTINSPNSASVTEISVDGLRGFDTFPSGQRQRFVYQFLLEGQVLTLAVTATTEENKVLADQIISTLKYDPSKFTKQSHIRKIVEPNFFYQLFLPDDWTYSFGTPAGIRLSDFQASSPDYQVVIEETDGPHDNISHKSGISLSLVILEDDSAAAEPAAGLIKDKYTVMYYGIEMVDYVFTEPSTAEGELREFRFFHNGLSYIFRFSYGAEVDQEELTRILLGLEIME